MIYYVCKPVIRANNRNFIEGITDKNKAVLHKRTSAVMLLGSKKVKSAVNTYLHELQNGAVIPNDHLALILNTLDNEIHSRSIFFSFK